MSVLSWVILLLVAAAIVIAVLAWFYRRATNEVSLVRTGIGGRKVVIDGGTLAIPFFHEISPVNMQTIRMDVQRTAERALITKDRMRIDVEAEFYASVNPEADSIARAAQTLGGRTFQPDQIKNLIEGMLVDALRTGAARMTMDELHENRAEFVGGVRGELTPVLARYGLELDRVSLTTLDQTPFASLDENNAFNAVGMRKLAEVIAKSKRERAEIEGESQVAVRRAEVEASRRKLEIELEERRAEIAQSQEVEIMLAAQLAEVARRKAEAEQEAANARINMEREIQSASLARELSIKEAEIAQLRALDIAEQERLILTSAKSMEGSKAKADATSARADLVNAESKIETLRAVAEAERRGKIALLNARQDAEANAARERISAENEVEIARYRTEARREEAEALKAIELAKAEADTAHIKAENTRSDQTLQFEREKARLAAMPGIIGQMVKPAEKIRGISINTINGLGQRDAKGEADSPVNQTIDAILNMAVAFPAMKKLGDSIGVNLEEVVPEKKE